jgi:hypothetical protein
VLPLQYQIKNLEPKLKAFSNLKKVGIGTKGSFEK